MPARADSNRPERLTASIGLDAGLHPDFSAAGRYGIPINVVRRSTPRRAVRFEYASEVRPGALSDPGPSPDRGRLGPPPADARSRRLPARRAVRHQARGGGAWSAGSGAVVDLRPNRLRPAGWTGADAAGLPILPGLARDDEGASAGIDHALRFTAPRTRSAYVYPSRHDAGESSDPALPPMGLRVRLRRGVSLAGLGLQGGRSRSR